MTTDQQIEEREKAIINLISSLLDEVYLLEKCVHTLDPTVPFRWFMIPVEDAITSDELIELFHPYELVLEVEDKTDRSISYNVYKMM